MSGALERRLSRLEARRGTAHILCVTQIFDPRDGANIEERVAAAELECLARGERLVAFLRCGHEPQQFRVSPAVNSL